MKEDEASPILGARFPRKRYDQFVSIAMRLRQNPSSLLRQVIDRYVDTMLTAGNKTLEELHATRRRLETELDHTLESLFVEQAKAFSSDEDPESQLLKRFVADFNEGGVEIAVANLRKHPEEIRTRVQTRLSHVLPDLWKQARPHFSGKAEGKP